MSPLEDVDNRGWLQSDEIFWFNVAFPDHLEDMLCLEIEDDEKDSEYKDFYGREVKNEDSNDEID